MAPTAVNSIKTDPDHYRNLWTKASFWVEPGAKPSSHALSSKLRLGSGTAADLFEYFGHPVVSARAWAALRPVLAERVETVEFKVGKVDLVWLVIPTNRGALDSKRSKSIKVGGKIFFVQKHIVDLGRVREPLFFFSGFHTPRCYCTDAVANVVVHEGLAGWDLKRVAGTASKARVRVEPPRPAKVQLAIMNRLAGHPSLRRPRIVDTVFHATTLEQQIQNGGVSQYVWNTRGKSFAAARKALVELGHDKALAFLDEIETSWNRARTEQARFLMKDVFDGRTALANQLDRHSKRYAKLGVEHSIRAFIEANLDELSEWATRGRR